MLSRELPKIVTASVPGPKCEAVIKRRADATLGAIRCPYPVVIDHAQGAVIEDLMVIDILIGLVAWVS